MPLEMIPGSSLRRVSEAAKNCYLIENIPLETLLFDRNLVGLDFTRACKQASVYYLEHFAPELSARPDVSELMLLSKGMYYGLHDAFEIAFNRNLPLNLMATRRARVEGDSAEIELPYINLDASGNTLLIGDTIASGATLCASIEEYCRHHSLDSVFMFSIAAAEVGVRRIFDFCSKRNIEVHIAVGLALFGLGENGFDMSFFHADTFTAEKYRRRAREVYQGLPVSVAGWDFGSQAQAPRKYRQLCWLESKACGLDAGTIFNVTERPDDFDLVWKERDAYRALPGISRATG